MKFIGSGDMAALHDCKHKCGRIVPRGPCVVIHMFHKMIFVLRVQISTDISGCKMNEKISKSCLFLHIEGITLDCIHRLVGLGLKFSV